MRVGLGPRFAIEAGFIIAVAVVAGIERLRTLLIVGLMGAAWLVVVVVEFLASRLRAGDRDSRGSRRAPSSAWIEPPRGVPSHEPQGHLDAQEEPAPVPEPDVSPGPRPEPLPTIAPQEPSAPDRAEPLPEKPEPAPEPPRIAAVVPLPETEREPEPEPEQVSEPEPPVVSLAARSTGPREWNLWDLERLAREPTGDPARDEERSYLLMYLREFAAADGVLPADFDGVVRESFGDVLDAAYS